MKINRTPLAAVSCGRIPYGYDPAHEAITHLKNAVTEDEDEYEDEYEDEKEGYITSCSSSSSFSNAQWGGSCLVAPFAG